MRRHVAVVTMVLVAALGVARGLAGEEVTLTGTLTCAKCTLENDDAKECQDVLVAQAEGTKTEYYIVSNEVAKKAGHNCKTSTPATVTGTVSERDGRKWITASKIEKGR